MIYTFEETILSIRVSRVEGEILNINDLQDGSSVWITSRDVVLERWVPISTLLICQTYKRGNCSAFRSYVPTN